MSEQFKLTVKRSFSDKSVRIGVTFNAWGRAASVSGKTDGDLSTSAARELAEALIAEADRADSIAAKKEAETDRRAKWREREIAAGRIKILGRLA